MFDSGHAALRSVNSQTITSLVTQLDCSMMSNMLIEH